MMSDQRSIWDSNPSLTVVRHSDHRYLVYMPPSSRRVVSFIWWITHISSSSIQNEPEPMAEIITDVTRGQIRNQLGHFSQVFHVIPMLTWTKPGRRRGWPSFDWFRRPLGYANKLSWNVYLQSAYTSYNLPVICVFFSKIKSTWFHHDMTALWYYKEHAVDMVLSDDYTHQLIQSIFTSNAYKLMLTRSPLSGFLSKQSTEQEKQVSPPHHAVVSISDDPFVCHHW